MEDWKSVILMNATQMLFFSAGFVAIWSISFLLRKLYDIGFSLAFTSIWIFFAYLFRSEQILLYPSLFGLHFLCIYWIGPFFYAFYSRLSEQGKISKSHWIFAFGLSSSSLVLVLRGAHWKYQFLSQISKPVFNSDFALFVFLQLAIKAQLLYYFARIMFDLYPFWTKRDSFFKKMHLLLFVFSFLFFSILSLGFLGFLLKNLTYIHWSVDLLGPLLISFYLFSSKYPNFGDEIKAEIIQIHRDRLKNIPLTVVLDRLQVLMDVEKAYSDEDLNLSKLAMELGIRSDQLSSLINQYYGENFNQWLNRYRVNEAMELLKIEKNRSILSIAYAVGFNSKTTFLRSFKSITNLSPSDYRNKFRS